jgi:hypothetical protein
MTFLVKMASQGEGGRDWGSLDGLMLEQGKMSPVGPWVECDGLQSYASVLGRRFDDLDHLDVPYPAEGAHREQAQKLRRGA